MLSGVAIRGEVAVPHLSGFFSWLLEVLGALIVNMGPRCTKLRVRVGLPRGSDVLVLVKN
jgi:hypothetical protein